MTTRFFKSVDPQVRSGELLEHGQPWVTDNDCGIETFNSVVFVY